MRLAVSLLALLGCAAAGPISQSTLGTNVSATFNPLTAEASGAAALHALVKRRLPHRVHHLFEFVLSEGAAGAGESEYDAFRIVEGRGGKVRIEGQTTSGLSRGLLTYLRTVGGDMYWSGTTFDDLLLEDFPSLGDNGLDGSSWAKWRYAFNVVTFSYTTAFYDWNQWEYLLDWSALHGINLPLATGGQEYIWREVFREMGLADEDIYNWFSGPAFQAWQRMGNIHGSWPRPVSAEWIDKQWDLQKRIIARMVALGMTPVLPAFNGFVPEALHDILDGPELLKASTWGDFPEQYTQDTALDPTWDTFPTVQSAFLAKQAELYGGWTSHYYSIDLFNELKPLSTDSDYLANNTRSVVASLRAVDPEAIWVMQGWLFVSDKKSWNDTTIPALLSGAAEDELLVLDLASEAIPAWNSTESFYGKPWLWNLLHDYGQNQGFYGSLEHYANEVIRARENSFNLIGTGITMEGMNQNELVYELTLDSAWSTAPVDVGSWLWEFIERRYGLCHPAQSAGAEAAHAAWDKLWSSAYNNTDFAVQAVVKSIVELVPSSTGLLDRVGHHPTKLTYDPRVIVDALDSLLASVDASPALAQVQHFKYDLVDTARQVLVNLAIPLYQEMTAAYNASSPNPTVISSVGSELVELLIDLDSVLATDEQFLLSSWIDESRSWSTNSTEADFLEYDARNQVTLWGLATTLPWGLNRYASKQWAGIVREYYVPSWKLFTDYLLATPVDAYNQTVFATHLRDQFELQWQTQIWGEADGQVWTAVGHAVEQVRAVREKWAGRLAEVYA